MSVSQVMIYNLFVGALTFVVKSWPGLARANLDEASYGEEQVATLATSIVGIVSTW